MSALRALCAVALAATPAGTPAPVARTRPTRDVLAVGNNGAGTADLIDPNTFKRLDRLDVVPQAGRGRATPGMSGAVRPMAIRLGERFVFFQVSLFFGIVRYDLRKDRVTRLLRRPRGDAKGLPRTRFPLDSAPRGLAMRPDGGVPRSYLRR